jgi:hypothetical protein
MTFDNFGHLIEFDEKERRLVIHRVQGNERHLLTFVELPKQTWSESSDEMREFCQKLGETLLLDSPIARKLLKI